MQNTQRGIFFQFIDCKNSFEIVFVNIISLWLKINDRNIFFSLEHKQKRTTQSN